MAIVCSHTTADHPDKEQKPGAAPRHPLGEGHQRHRAAFTLVVGPHQDRDVFDRDDEGQGPQDQRHHA